jgi:predicted O-methyltransferase YrrM
LQLLLWRVLQWIRWYWAAKTIYRIHSPALFGLVRALFDRASEQDDGVFDEINEIRQQLLASDLKIEYHDHGAGPSGQKNDTVTIRSVADLAHSSASDAQQGTLLFRLVQHLKPKSILELGSSLGIGSLYLTSPDRNVHFVGIEGNPDSASIAQSHLQTLGCVHAVVLAGVFHEYLPKALLLLPHIDLVYMDGDHRLEPTLAYFEQILPNLTERAVVILDDIYWNADMLRAYEQIKAHPQVKASLDLWHMGIVFFDPAFEQKVHLKVVPSTYKWWERYV